jgi:hypothetical protein
VAGGPGWNNAVGYPPGAAPGSDPFAQYAAYQQIAGAPQPIADPGMVGTEGDFSGGGGYLYPDCDTCPSERIWAEAELLIWWRQGRTTPALITTSPAGTDRLVAGTIGEPTTEILYGGERSTGDPELGARLEVGMWLDDCARWGVGASVFMLGNESGGYDTGFSRGDPILARPFINGLTGMQDALLIAYDEPPPPLPQGNDIVDGRIVAATGNEV